MSSRRSMTGEARGAMASRPGGGDAGKNPFQGVLDKENKPDGACVAWCQAVSSRVAPCILRCFGRSSPVSSCRLVEIRSKQASSNTRFYGPAPQPCSCWGSSRALCVVVDGFCVRVLPDLCVRVEPSTTSQPKGQYQARGAASGRGTEAAGTEGRPQRRRGLLPYNLIWAGSGARLKSAPLHIRSPFCLPSLHVSYFARPRFSRRLCGRKGFAGSRSYLAPHRPVFSQTRWLSLHLSACNSM